MSTLAESKNAIKTAIEAKGVAVGQAAFSEYADKIQAIPVAADEPTYTRPADWLEIPEIGEDEEVVYLLMRVDTSGATAYVYVTTSDGSKYTVDYGDGSETQLIASGQQFYKSYTFANLPDSSMTTLGYKQALIKVTAAGGIRELYPISTNTGTNYGSKYLQVVANVPNCVKIGTYSYSSANGFVHLYMEIFDIRKHNLTSLKEICKGMKSLRMANLGDTSKVTDFSSAFYECNALTHLPELDTSAATTLIYFCYQCSSLRHVPPMDTRRVTEWSSAFGSCTCLTKLPPLNFIRATSLGSIFSSCYSLRDFTLHNTPQELTLSDTKPEKSVLVANVLSNLGNVSGKRLILPATIPLYNLTAEEKALATAKGWTLA